MRPFFVMRVRSVALLLLFALLVFGHPCLGQPSESEVKAAFLYNFTRFVSWPKEEGRAEGPIVLAVLAGPGFASVLRETVEGKTVDGRPLVVRHARTPADVMEAHILYIAGGDEELNRQVLDRLGNRPVLTVSEHPEFSAMGGMVRFFRRDRRVAFEINPAAAERAGLRVSSRLLGLAQVYLESQ